MTKSPSILIAILLATHSPAVGAVSFVRDIAPIFVRQCVECHREGKSKGAYRMDHFSALLKPGDSKSRPVIAGKPDESELLRLIASHDEDERMPRKGDALPEKQQALIRQWIAEGAKFDGKDANTALATLLPEQPRPGAPEKYPRPLPVTALAVINDGATIAVSGYHEITLWDALTGKLTARIANMPEQVNAICRVGTSKTLAVAGGSPMRSGEVWLIDTDKRKATRRILTTRDSVLALACSRDGSLLATGGADNRARLFSMPDGKKLWDTEPHADWITALCFSPDGKHLATASRDRTARLLFPASGEIEATHTGHETAVLSLAYTSDSKEVLSGDTTGLVRRWDRVGDSKANTSLRPGRVEVLQLGFIDAMPVAAMSNGLVASVNPETRAVKDKLARHDDRVNAMEIFTRSGAGPLLVTGSHDGVVRVFDLLQSKEVISFVASPGLRKE